MTDPETGHGSDYKSWTIEQMPAPATGFVDGMAPVFSPRANLEALGFLIEDGDWTKSYFDPSDKSARMARRLYFSGGP
jgi:hypothetical protein